MVQWKPIQLGTMMLWVRSLASFSGLRMWHCHELWCRPAAVVPIRPLAWEPPYVRGVALKRKGKKKKKEREKRKLKQHRHQDITFYLVDWQKFKILTDSVGKAEAKAALTYLAGVV